MVLEVRSIDEEIAFWESQTSGGATSIANRRAAEQYLYYLRPVAGAINDVRSSDSSNIVQFAENTYRELDDLWRQTEVTPYPERRMRNVLNLIGT